MAARSPSSSFPTKAVVVAVVVLILGLIVWDSVRPNKIPSAGRAPARTPSGPSAAATTPSAPKFPCASGVCRYDNAPAKVSINFPESWQVREGLFGTVVSFFSPLQTASDQFSENLNIVIENVAPGTTLAAYHKASEENLKKYFTEFKSVKKENATLDGAPALVVTYQAAQGIVKLRTTQIFALKDNRAYIVTISNLQGSPDMFFADMAAIAGSFKFLP